MRTDERHEKLVPATPALHRPPWIAVDDRAHVLLMRTVRVDGEDVGVTVYRPVPAGPLAPVRDLSFRCRLHIAPHRLCGGYTVVVGPDRAETLTLALGLIEYRLGISRGNFLSNASVGLSDTAAGDAV